MKQREKNKTLILIFLFRGKNIERGKIKKKKQQNLFTGQEHERFSFPRVVIFTHKLRIY